MSNAAPWKKGKASDTEAEIVDTESAPVPESMALAVPADSEESAVATTGGKFSHDASGLTMDDVSIPLLRLANGLTKEVQDRVAESGQWLLTGNEPADRVEIVILGFGKRRAYRDADSQEILCRSDDGITGHGDPGGNCDLCPFAQWGDKNPRTGKSKPPLCAFYYSYQGYSLTQNSLCQLDLKRTALAAAKQINALLLMKKVGNFALILGSRQETSGNNTYYTPTVSSRALTPDERAQLAEFAAALA